MTDGWATAYSERERQFTFVKNWGLCPFGGGGAGSPSYTMWPGPRPTCMPSFILIHPTIWPQYTVTDRQTGQDREDRQWSDSIGRTVLQTVTQKLKPGLVTSYNIQPGNGEGLHWFRHCINLSLTYLPTYLQPWDPHGACLVQYRSDCYRETEGTTVVVFFLPCLAETGLCWQKPNIHNKYIENKLC